MLVNASRRRRLGYYISDDYQDSEEAPLACGDSLSYPSAPQFEIELPPAAAALQQ